MLLFSLPNAGLEKLNSIAIEQMTILAQSKEKIKNLEWS